MSEPTIYDVARTAGVSPSTVSRALQGKDRVSEKTRAKVFEASSRLGFTASKEASRLRSGKTRRIALILGNYLAGWYSSELSEGVYSALSLCGYDLLSYRVANMEQRERFFASMPVKRNADAVIISSFTLSDQEGQVLHALGVPIVSVNTMHLNDNYSDASIGIDELGTLQGVIHQLAAIGHQRIAFIRRDYINTDFVWDADQRVKGYYLGMEKADLVVPQGYEISLPYSTDAGKIAVGKILSLNPRPTAICCISDELAICLVHELRHYGIRVPEDISVMGFDDLDLAGPLGISSVRHEPRIYGRTAGQMAISLAKGEHLNQDRQIVDTAVILRETVGPVPQEKTA